MSTAPRRDALTPEQQALVAVRAMKARLEAIEQARTEPIAIVGMGCRFPGGVEGAEAFWSALREGRDLVSEVPPDRWDIAAYYDPDPDAPGKMYTRHGGFVDGIDAFDAAFFGISPREAASMDPQQRLLLEVAWQALEDAGLPPDRLAGTETGVFVGVSTSDYGALLLKTADPSRVDVYFGTGNAPSAAAGRLSYVLGLQGPAIAVDTACSSSLVALHLACQSLRARECDAALAGGVNAILAPEVTINMSRARMMSPDGRCKTFDAAADGYVRGEGCGVVVLKRLSDAVAGGDRILALVRGSAVNQDGRSGGFTAPSETAQQAVLRKALAAARVAPADVGYVEAHGTGTALGDPIEVHALSAVLGAGRTAERPLVLGSVKTNFGHLEAAAGIAGVIKVALALRHAEIPPHLHFRRWNPHVVHDGGCPMAVPTERRPWPAAEGRRIAGVSSFGFTGTNAHVVLESHAAPPVEAERPDRPLHVVALSARSGAALAATAARLAGHVGTHASDALADVAHTVNAGRSHFGHRLAVIAATREQLLDRLRPGAEGRDGQAVIRGSVEGGAAPEVAFLFTGQGAQYAQMGRGLYQTQPAFREALDRCDEALGDALPRPLVSVIHGAGEPAWLGDAQYAQPALFALQWALARMWRSWGVEPAWVMGHSLGEYAAACVAGVFTLEDGLRLVAERGRLMQALPESGVMAAALAGERAVRAAVERVGGPVAVAAVNGPESVVVSGSAAAVAAVRAELEAGGIRTRPLAVSHAFHSPLMAPIEAEFARAVERVALARPAIGLVSNVSGRPAGDEVTDPAYWVRHLREPVRFADGIASLDRERCAAFVEIGPAPTLIGLGRACLPGEGRLWLGSLRRDGDDWAEVLQGLAVLYAHGTPVDWAGFDRGYARRRVALPTYPFERKRYWAAGPALPPPAPSPGVPLEDRLYEVAWRARPRAETAARTGPGRWLLLADGQGVAAELARLLERRGERCTLLGRPAAKPGGPAEVEAAVRALIKEDAAPLRGVVHLWTLDGEEEAAADEPAVTAAVTVAAAVRALAAEERPGARVFVVTRAGQAACGRGEALAPAAAWGAGRVAALEHPDLWGGLVDLDPAGDTDAARLFDELWAPDGEDQVAWRGGARYVARLVPRAAEALPAPVLRPDGAYLVTGGLGALGLRVAGWLVARGARHLVLVGRRQASPDAQAAIARWSADGVEVRVAQADAADRERMREVLAGASAPLRGVVHAAGIMDPCALAALGADQVRATFRAKLLGAHVLHELTRDAPLELFVAFSSASGVWGAVGLAHYAAANQAVDALIRERRRRGLPGLSVAWGPWEGGGMAAGDSREWLGRMGVRPLPAAEGLRALEQLLAAGVSEATVASVDWRTFRTVYEARGSRRLLEEIEAPTPETAGQAAPAAEASALQRELAGAGADGRRDVLARWLSRLWRDVLHVEQAGPADDFFALGGDSIMGLQVITRASALGLRVSLKQLLDHPTPGELAAVIATGGDAEPAAAASDVGGTVHDAGALTAADLAAIGAELERSAELPR
ncbi:MAG TPA: SDR family NAD(P)-dependent oxidoreductase [Vicinamibacteria bacterium]